MGLLQILAIAALTCLGSGYAQDVFVSCGSSSNAGIYSAPADALDFTKVYSVAADAPMVFDDSGRYVYIYIHADKNIMKYDLTLSAVVTNIAVDAPTGCYWMLLDGDTLYFNGEYHPGGLYSIDLSAADPSQTETLVAPIGQALEASIVGRDIYMTMWEGVVNAEIRRFNLDTLQTTVLTSSQMPWGLVVDSAGNALYYGSHSDDMTIGKITRYDLGSGAETTVISNSQYLVTAIALYDGGLLYIATNNLYKVAKTGGEPTAVGKSHSSLPSVGSGLNYCTTLYDVKVVHDLCKLHHTVSYTHTGRIRNSDFAFVFKEVPSGVTTFTISIKGSGFAYIALSPSNEPADDEIGDVGFPKIEIGRKENQKSAGYCNTKDKPVFITGSPNVLSATDYRDYRVSFANGHLEISVDGQVFLSEDMTCLGDVKYIGVATGQGNEADWKICGL
ncbi:uncharacterized protein [Amphiura filiformis]|uniref:uncharacterized protein n=1 Tax=Amphiura filiformis TaxID=82378 RepID=UPI003B219B08